MIEKDNNRHGWVRAVHSVREIETIRCVESQISANDHQARSSVRHAIQEIS
jgi:hypothetical protein